MVFSIQLYYFTIFTVQPITTSQIITGVKWNVINQSKNTRGVIWLCRTRYNQSKRRILSFRGFNLSGSFRRYPYRSISISMDSERGNRINAFLIVRHVLFFFPSIFFLNTSIHFSLLLFLYILLYIETLLYYNHFYRKDMPTAFSPLGGLSSPQAQKSGWLMLNAFSCKTVNQFEMKDTFLAARE